MRTSVAVVGSANVDVVTPLPRFPEPGETLLGDGLREVAGGKGLNQAVAAARLVPTAFVACIGSDDGGTMLLGHLVETGVDRSGVMRMAGPTGRALIQVVPGGENSIVVVPLANEGLTREWVDASLTRLRPACVLSQLEIPGAAVEAAAAWAEQHGSRFVLNASPVRALPDAVLRACDPLVVNAGEAVALLGDDPGPRDRQRSPAELAAALSARARSVVVTDGPNGVHVATQGSAPTHVPGIAVSAVDTTGAGDEFVGTLVAELSRGSRLEEAAEAANRAAAAIVVLERSARVRGSTT